MRLLRLKTHREENSNEGFRHPLEILVCTIPSFRYLAPIKFSGCTLFQRPISKHVRLPWAHLRFSFTTCVTVILWKLFGAFGRPVRCYAIQFTTVSDILLHILYKRVDILQCNVIFQNLVIWCKIPYIKSILINPMTANTSKSNRLNVSK